MSEKPKNCELRLCGCGCGGSLPQSKRAHRQPIFLQGHYDRNGSSEDRWQDRKCIGCGDSFKVRIRGEMPSVCGKPECAKEARRKGKKLQAANAPKKDVKCDWCGTMFSVSANIKRITRRFCSKACASHLQTIAKAERSKAPNLKCRNCGQLFYVMPCHERVRKYCSQKCATHSLRKLSDVVIGYIKWHLNVGVSTSLLAKYFKCDISAIHAIQRKLTGKDVKPDPNAPAIKFASKPTIRLTGERAKKKLVEVYYSNGPTTQTN